MDLLCRYTRASGQRVQGDSFPEEDFADGTADGSAVFDGLEALAFTDMPFDPVYMYIFSVLVTAETVGERKRK